jgi:hypothetical protein
LKAALLRLRWLLELHSSKLLLRHSPRRHDILHTAGLLLHRHLLLHAEVLLLLLNTKLMLLLLLNAAAQLLPQRIAKLPQLSLLLLHRWLLLLDERDVGGWKPSVLAVAAVALLLFVNE